MKELKKFVFSCLIVAVVFDSISIVDVDKKKVAVIIHYLGHEDDRIIVDRDKLDSEELSQLVERIVNKRTK